MAVSILITALAVALSPRCQLMADQWCNSDIRCSNSMKHTDLLARNSTSHNNSTSEWRCYGKESLSPDENRYLNGTHYCTRGVELRALIDSCEASPETSFVEVFTPFEGGYPCIRIPAIIRMPQLNRIIAFAECRNWTGDGCIPTPPNGVNVTTNPNRDVCMKYSDDGGVQWSELLVILRASQQPTPVYSVRYNMAVLQYVSRVDNLVYQSTSVDGIVWSKPTKVSVPSSQVGPGPGLELSDGNLVFIGHNSDYAYDSVWYGGLNAGQYTLSANSTSTLYGMNEASITQLPSGILMANMRNRNYSQCSCRGFSLSHDGGVTWSLVEFDKELIDPVNQASIVTNIDQKILFANSASTTGRVNGTLSVGEEIKTSGFVKWNSRTMLWNGAFAYSCLTTLGAARSVGLLWETNGPQCQDLNDASCRTVYSHLTY